MNKNSCVTEPDGPEIEGEVVLEFVLKRFNEILQSERSKVPSVLQGLGLVGLAKDQELLGNYKAVLSSPHLPPKEIIRRSVEILQLGLDSDPVSSSSEPPKKQDEDDRGLDEKASRHIMMVALREGRQMLQEHDVRFVRIFEMLGWIGLQSDPEWLAEFEAVRRSLANDPEALIEAGRDILRDALFRRRPSGRVQPLSN